MTTEVLAFVNPRSGGGQGAWLDFWEGKDAEKGKGGDLTRVFVGGNRRTGFDRSRETHWQDERCQPLRDGSKGDLGAIQKQHKL